MWECTILSLFDTIKSTSTVTRNNEVEVRHCVKVNSVHPPALLWRTSPFDHRCSNRTSHELQSLTSAFHRLAGHFEPKTPFAWELSLKLAKALVKKCSRTLPDMDLFHPCPFRTAFLFSLETWLKLEAVSFRMICLASVHHTKDWSQALTDSITIPSNNERLGICIYFEHTGIWIWSRHSRLQYHKGYEQGAKNT